MTDQPTAQTPVSPAGPGDRADYGVGAAITGSLLWAAALLWTLVARGRLAERGQEWLIPTCAAGVLIGLVMLVLFRRRRAVYEAHA